MRFDIITIFPEFFGGPLDYGIVRRAREAGLIEVAMHDLRDFTHDRHRTVDDRPFGGGEGMVMKPEPLFEAVEALLGTRETPAWSRTAVVLLSASGTLFRQETARRFSKLERLVLLCGRYEGVDERVAEHLATEEISVGDFVLSGGELPAMMILDAVTRLLPGALGNEDSTVNESFSPATKGAISTMRHGVSAASEAPAPGSKADCREMSPGILDYPHFTRPPVFRGWGVPDVLMTGNHDQIRRWRRQMALRKTLRNRPDLVNSASLSDEDRHILVQINESKARP